MRMVTYAKFLCVLYAFPLMLWSATNVISDQLPTGMTLADVNLGTVPVGNASKAVRLVELATLPGEGQVQQIVSWGESLYVVLREGRVWEYDLQGNVAGEPLLDLASLRPNFSDGIYWQPSSGLRGFAKHPEFESNGLCYTLHEELSDGSEPDYGKTYLDKEYILAEWNFDVLVDGVPSFRMLFRIRFEHSWHTGQHIGFNPVAAPGDSDYGMLYASFGDNGVSVAGGAFIDRTVDSDPMNVGQDFGIIHSSLIRIEPTDPSSKSDLDLAAEGLKRASNGRFSIPLDNPFIGQPGVKEEIFAKGFRNPLTMSFSPAGSPIIADVGEQTIEEVNVVNSGGNYGYPVREGTFLVPWADQIDGSPLGADASMVWMPAGTVEEPAVTYYVRDKDQTNLRLETLARTGPYGDGYVYPVFQFSHEGNHRNGTSAVAGGNYYRGFWAEELHGLYLFGNISTDQIFYGAASALDSGIVNAEVWELPLVDQDGMPTDLATIIGNERANMRFGKDSYGNLYLASKTNKKLYRFQGTPELKLGSVSGEMVEEEGSEYFEFSLDRPPQDGSVSYTLEVTNDLAVGFAPADEADYAVQSVVALSNGMERVRYRYLVPVDPGTPRFFRIDWD